MAADMIVPAVSILLLLFSLLMTFTLVIAIRSFFEKK